MLHLATKLARPAPWAGKDRTGRSTAGRRGVVPGTGRRFRCRRFRHLRARRWLWRGRAGRCLRRGRGGGLAPAAGGAGAGAPGGSTSDGEPGSSVATSHTSPPAGGPDRGRAWRPAAATAASNADTASCITTPTASVAAATCEARPGPDSRSLRRARQIGHQAHSGGSSSAVAVSHTSPCPPPRSAVRIWSFSPRLTPRALVRSSHRCTSPTRSLAGCLGSCVTSRPLPCPDPAAARCQCPRPAYAGPRRAT